MNRRSLLLVTSSACALTIFDTNLVGVILPSLVAGLGGDYAQMAWVQSSFLLSFASLLMASGALSDRYGRRRMLTIGLCVFAFSALACSLAPTMVFLVSARVLQGVGAALLLAPALSIIGHAFREQHEAVQAWTTWGRLMGLTMVIAPLLSSSVGYLLGWRWAFGILAFAGAILVLAVPRVVHANRSDRVGAFDWCGALVFSLTLLAWTWGLINGPDVGWMSQWVVLAVLIGLAGLCVFITIELYQRKPMLELRLFRLPRFLAAVFAMFAYAASAQVMAALLPLYLQRGLDISFLWLGCALLPFSLGMFFAPSLTRRIAGRWDSLHLLAVGLAVIALGNTGLFMAARSGGVPEFLFSMAVLGAGGGFINGETQKAILGALPPEQTGMGAGISTTARFFGMLVGYAGLSAIMAQGVMTRLQMQVCGAEGANCQRLRQSFESILTGQYSDFLSGDQASARLADAVYRAGFSDLFAWAALIAVLAAGMCVMLCGRKGRKHVL
ncbi:EmrB/QacA subfamily drug resistance transporter [Marinobacterium sp. MBR-111]|jgi:EmrB/QacA subfamily drug resistance transporter|uniref:MFS transporter n=1 Tax=Marinobacterium sp. MBR-111 TaxID=3156463 RepID=UPI003397C6E4